nr:MAG: hypothetical protein OI861_00235 [Candidatus Methanoperedens sp.]
MKIDYMYGFFEGFKMDVLRHHPWDDACTPSFLFKYPQSRLRYLFLLAFIQVKDIRDWNKLDLSRVFSFPDFTSFWTLRRSYSI